MIIGTKQVEQNAADIKELQRNLRDALRQVEALSQELSLQQDTSAHERKMNDLRYENLLLRVEKLLLEHGVDVSSLIHRVEGNSSFGRRDNQPNQ